MYEAARCPNCGTFPNDWIDPEDGTQMEPPPLEVKTIKCYGCIDLEDTREVQKGAKGLHHHFGPWTGLMDQNLEEEEEDEDE